ncbi:MAG: PilZ domain-containing protein [Rhodanobacteraceae bacterium]|nr:MAG: PilZ domain-containing protein [Rhodanobacteraceae bacterium]
MFAVADEPKPEQLAGPHVRHARMLRQTAVLMSRRGDVWQTDLVDISATGVRLLRPAGWQARAGDVWVLDMLFGDKVNVHVMAEVVRVGEQFIALAFARIPEDTQQALWTLLGGCADALEPWDEDAGDGAR